MYLDGGAISYDYLIVATGSRFTWFGNENWRTRAPGLKTIADGLEIRERIFRAFEAAEREGDERQRRAWLTCVIVNLKNLPLPKYPEALRRNAANRLRALGVEQRMDTAVEEVSDRGVILDGGEEIEAHTVMWAAGVEATPIARSLEAPLDDAGRVQVEPDLSIPDHPEIFVAGDLVAL